jgi:hypothetical protein
LTTPLVFTLMISGTVSAGKLLNARNGDVGQVGGRDIKGILRAGVSATLAFVLGKTKKVRERQRIDAGRRLGELIGKCAEELRRRQGPRPATAGRTASPNDQARI